MEVKRVRVRWMEETKECEKRTGSRKQDWRRGCCLGLMRKDGVIKGKTGKEGGVAGWQRGAEAVRVGIRQTGMK